MDSVRSEYERGHALAVSKIATSHLQKQWCRNILIACGLLTVLAVLLSLPKTLFIVALVIVSGVAWQYNRANRAWREAGRERDFLQRGLDRLDGKWTEQESSGEEYRQIDHVYQDDFNIFGPGSLFQMLCTTRTKLGEDGLARFLTDVVPLAESRARQAAVKELVPRNGLRFAVACLGKASVTGCAKGDLADWLALPVLRIYPVVHRCMQFSAVISFLVAIGIYSKALDWHLYWPWLVGLGCLTLIGAAWHRSAVIERLVVLRPIGASLTLLVEGIELLESQRFHSEKLQRIVAELKSDHATKRLRRLADIFWWLEQREKPYFLFTVCFGLGTLIVFSAEKWREENATKITEWVEAWSTFEALQSLACCSYERPRWTFPEFASGQTCFSSTGLGHPMLPEEKCIRNDVSLGHMRRYLFVSGSNMAGKSTLLRAIGLNGVLAYAGGPVCAQALTLTHLMFYASIAVQDNLTAGKSRFMAEIQRLAAVVSASREGRSVLFLIDEILSGTNSHDRHFVAKIFLQRVLRSDVIGVLTSHDLALVENVPDDAIWHMASQDLLDPLKFDYKLRPGLVRGSNALAIARLAGLLE